MRKTNKVISQFGFQTRKSLGQHFLVDERVLIKIVELAAISPDDYVLEIGPGPGSLTKYLVQKAKKVIAIEFDEELTGILKNEIKSENLVVIQADVLKYNFNDIDGFGNKLKVVSNLPYNISTEVIFKLLETPGVFSELYLMLQQEVAKRIVADPGKKDFGILAAICRLHSDPEIILNLGPEVFKPRPKVNSSLVRFRVLAESRFPVLNYHEFKKVVRACFSMRRKMLKNSFGRSGLGPSPEIMESLLSKADIDPTARAETVPLEKLVKLANLFFMENPKNAGTS